MSRALAHPRTRLVAACVAIILVACTPVPTPRQGIAKGTAEGAQAPAKQLVIALEGEPDNLIIGMGSTGGVNVASILRLAIHQHLAHYDDRGDVHPMLAAELPSVARGTWVVREDGTMQTTYRLRPGVTWHDGTPLTARDFVLAWTVANDPELPIARRTVANQIARIDTPTEHTLVLEWSEPYPFAHAVAEEDLGPLPAHLLEAIYRSDTDRFQQLPYWTREAIGVGPYRLSEWEPGSHLVLQAFPDFYAGQPKITTLTFRFVPSADTVVANLLSGSVDGALKRALTFDQAMLVKSQWEQEGRRPVVIVQPTHWRHMIVQFRDPKPREILEVRVRRGLLHALDRRTMVDALLAGQAPVSDTFIPPDELKWEWVKDVAVTYPFDVRRAHELFRDAGWTRAGDGPWMNSTGEPVAIPVWSSGSEKNVRELAIIGDYWKAAGVTVQQVVNPSAQARDNRFLASFPAFGTFSVPATFRNTLKRAYGPGCPTEQTRWVGTSTGCYQNAELDRLVDALTSAIDPSEQRALYRDLIRLHTEELPLLPLYFDVQVALFREGVVGVKGETKPNTSVAWNIAEWDIR